jgi:hypothetical protein
MADQPSSAEDVVVICPALDEEATIDGVVRTALKSPRVRAVWVVDNNSSDATADRAVMAGAHVVRCETIGKSEAVRTGLHEVKGYALLNAVRTIVLLDGDLEGLRPDHIEALVAPLDPGTVDMVCGHLCNDSGRRFFLPLPLHVLTGQRAVTIEVLERVDWERWKGYLLEVGLTAVVQRTKVRRVMLSGVTHTRREMRGSKGWMKGSVLPPRVRGLAIRGQVGIAFCGIYARSTVQRCGNDSATSRIGNRDTESLPQA